MEPLPQVSSVKHFKATLIFIETNPLVFTLNLFAWTPDKFCLNLNMEQACAIKKVTCSREFQMEKKTLNKYNVNKNVFFLILILV